jgi:rubrerythrin
MVYRPTVRYPEIYRDFVEDIFKATSLDRNQILRLATFAAAHSKEFQSILEKHKFGDVPLPHPDWGLDEEECWKNQNYIKEKTNKKSVP